MGSGVGGKLRSALEISVGCRRKAGRGFVPHETDCHAGITECVGWGQQRPAEQVSTPWALAWEGQGLCPRLDPSRRRVGGMLCLARCPPGAEKVFLGALPHAAVLL